MKKTITVQNLEFVPLISRAEIAGRVQELGLDISAKYHGKCPLFLCILNGSFIFAADLVRACELECEVAFVRLSSYAGLQSSGKIVTVLGLDKDINNRDIIVVEDIIDSGQTMHQFLSDLKKMEPASIATAVLLLKPEALRFPLETDFLGFEIPDKFVLGYGLDYNGLGRNLADIYQLSPK